MRTRLLFPALTSTALVLLALSAGGARAGSFFGPSCYGADYGYRYPNRSHIVFGCGPGCPCRMWHPFFWHRRSRCNQCGSNDGMPVGAMPAAGMPGNAMPIEQAQVPLEPSPFLITPVQSTWLAPPPRPAVLTAKPTAPMPESRLIPFPRTLPSAPAGAEPPQLDSTGK